MRWGDWGEDWIWHVGIYSTFWINCQNIFRFSRISNERLPSGEVNNFSRYIVGSPAQSRGLFDKYHWVWGDYFAGKGNVSFPINISLSVCKFWCYVSPLRCSDCWKGSAFHSHPWNWNQLSVKNVFRQWEIFPEVAVYTDACADIYGKLLIYLCVISKVNIYVEAHGYYSPSDKTL